jgi:HlyD family secretion protein
MQSATQENVVSYTVAVDVSNPDGKLLPGMTATVSFLVDAVRNTLRVPNAALRFRPSEALLARAVRDTVLPADTGGRRTVPVVPGRTATARDTASRATTAFRRGELWYIAADGTPSSKVVRLGLTDGSFTQVVGSGITEGMQIIAGVLDGSAATSTGTNPFQTNRPRGGPGGPPPGP